MIRKVKIVIYLVICFFITTPMMANARAGDSGYEGGISSGEVPTEANGKSQYDYQEVCFITGEPIVLKGDLKITKSVKKDIVVTTYQYINLKNIDKNVVLNRTIVLDTKISKKDNGQIIEITNIGARTPTESIKIKNVSYTLKKYKFSRTSIIDQKPAINYYLGKISGEKVYSINSGTGSGTGTIVVTENGKINGYDQYWGTTETQILGYLIQSEKKNGEKVDKWGGTANIVLSSNTTKKIDFVDNMPEQISFRGGFVQSQHNESIMEYNCKFKEFDSKGNATNKTIETNNSLKMESFPAQTGLLVPNLSHLRGHPAEEYVKQLYSLEIFKGNDRTFKPEQFITRAEFASAINAAAREVPLDPALVKKTTQSAAKKKETLISIFDDVSTENSFFSSIETAYKRGLMEGVGNNNFSPKGYVTVADAAAVFVRALGLEELAPNPVPVTTFKDNDKIPSYARKSAYVADKLGLVEVDSKGYLNPNQKLTKGNAAKLIVKFIKYMQDDIRKDYREYIVNY